MAAMDASSTSFREYTIPMIATPIQQVTSFPAGQSKRKKRASGDRCRPLRQGKDTPLLAYIHSRPETQQQSRTAKDLPPSIQVPVQDISSPFHEHGKCGTPFLSTTKVKSVPLPVLYIKRQYNVNNQGVRNVPLCSNRYAPVPKRTRLRSDSLLDLHREKKCNKLHEHLVEGKYNLEQSRLLKLQSEIIPHRLNHGYYMSGKVMSLRDRYAVPEEELLRLKKLTLSANAGLYYGKGMSQKKAVKSRHGEMLEDQLTALRGDEDDGNQMDVSKSDNSESEAAESKGSDIEDDGAVLAVPEPAEKKISITLTSGPSKTFITDFKSTELDDIIDEDLIEIYRKKFQELDIDGSGSITLDELKATLFGAASDADIQFIMSLFDLDNSNSIELEEFIAVASLNDKILGKKRTADEPLDLDLTQLSQHLQQYKELFGLFDDDGNGSISVEELMILLSASMGIDKASSPEYMEGIMRKMDKDNSGTIDFYEFLRFIPFFLGVHDKILSEPLSVRHLHNAKTKVRQHLRQ